MYTAEAKAATAAYYASKGIESAPEGKWSDVTLRNDFYYKEKPGIPNTVSSLLADYRGFDTMFETAVIFVAGISMIILLRRRQEDPLPGMDTAHHATIKKGDEHG